jgi:hypothetical protein
MMRFAGVCLAIAVLTVPAGAQPIDPLPVDEAALITRLIEMAQPTRGERAVIVFDPSYYPGVTNGLRERLLELGVHSTTIVDDTAGMIAQQPEDSAVHRERERVVIESLLPLFERSQIFYWMPVRAYVSDLRWEYLVERSRIRSIHFHWLLPFPGSRSDDQIRREHAAMVRRTLEVDHRAHAELQRRLAGFLAGKTLHVTTAAGTDLRIQVPRDQWFHRGDGDASAARATTARSLRDREMELPVGMFNFVPAASTVNGKVRVAAMSRVPDTVRDVSFDVVDGRMSGVAAGGGLEDLRASIKEIGADGDMVATVWFHTNPFFDPPLGMMVEFGSNWENGGTNRAHRASRISVTLRDARVVADGVVVMEDGRFVWDRIR